MTAASTKNAPQWVRVDDLVAQGYEVMGYLDKDSTEEDIHDLASKMAEKMTPPIDHPIWREIVEDFIQEASPRNYVMMRAECDELRRFQDELPAYLAAGGDEDEYWARIRQENETRWESRNV